jgi:hypothetical protein
MAKFQSRKKIVQNEKNGRNYHLIREYVLMIIIFLVSLFFITTFSNPGLFINDEWITTNQLYQLGSGHQVIVNEGTYGTHETGEVAEFFIARGNVLQYTLILPIISLPVLLLFSLFGDNFRFLIILLWSFIPLFIGLLIGTYYPQYGKLKGVSWIWPVIILSFILFLVNISIYYPFAFISTGAPKEVVSIVFANHILFALTAVILYQCAMLMYSSDKWKAIFAAILVLANSSFLFWAGNAKDHMLVAFLFSLVILFFIRYFTHRNFLDAAFGFLIIGILTWARPEVGFFVFLLSALWILIFNYHYPNNLKENKTHTFLGTFGSILCVIPGIIPFLINNYLVTGSPFTPTFFVGKTVEITGTTINPVTGNISSVIVGGVTEHPLNPVELLNSILSILNFSPYQILSSLPRVLFLPENGNMGLITVCPLAIFAIITLISLFRKKICPVDSPLILYLTMLTIAIFLAYINLFPIISTDPGIVPDMRWLSPIYIPLGLMGTFSVFTFLAKIPVKDLLKKYLAIAIISVPVFFLLIIILQPFGGVYKGYSIFYELIIYLLFGLIFMGWLAYRRGLIKFQYLVMGILVLLAIPFSWQMMMVFLYSVVKFDGYPFWIPIVEQFFNVFFHVRDVSSVHLLV